MRLPSLGGAVAVQHRRGRVRQAPARQAGDDLGELRRRDARARLGRAPGSREPGGAHAGGARGRAGRPGRGRAAADARDGGDLLRRLEARRDPALDVGALRRRRHRHRLADSERALLVTDADNAPRFDRSWAPDVLVLDEPTLAAAPTDFVCADTAADDPAQLYYTSGTTGLAKGIVHAHRYILAHEEFALLPRGAGRRALPRDGRVGVGCRHRAAARAVAARRRAVRLPARGRLRPAQAARLPQPAPGHERLHDADRDALDDGDRRRRHAVSAELPPGVLRWRAAESRRRSAGSASNTA